VRPSPQKAIMARLARWGVFVQEVHAGLLPALYAATSPDAAGAASTGQTASASSPVALRS
jgi:hypothetical protein